MEHLFQKKINSHVQKAYIQTVDYQTHRLADTLQILSGPECFVMYKQSLHVCNTYQTAMTFKQHDQINFLQRNMSKPGKWFSEMGT